ncbi:uncharacterized protein LOC119555968 [Drosophila subpulchrella]|uniref:uncharacterized protein LOC119555968 n=1 Tax=Drosophila subpulchrella TaxID=1486046 RepID=UPI0018A14734|nr:uncharacterized protein LOC119555968 [Drosophila subpulchrella]
METEGSRSEDIGPAKTGPTLSEESLGSSSSSSVLNSWTILPVVKEKDDGLEKTEELADLRPSSRADKQKIERCNRVAAEDPQADDISDGISIISDCESTDRISPNLFMREPLLGDLGFGDLPTSSVELIAPIPISTGQQLKEYPERDEVQVQESTNIVRSKFELELPPLVQNGLTAFFYVAATLSILAFVGKLRNPEWQVLGEDKPLVELERRVGELELQNNLLRAEIDIMSKKLQYLLGSGQDGMQRQGAGRAKGKTFKAWPGNGDNVSPVDITKADLKQPFQCPDGRFVEIAGMCVENKQHLDELTDEIGSVVNDVLQQSGAFHKFEKITEKLGSFAGDESENVDAKAGPRAGNYQPKMDGPETVTSHGQSSKLADGSKDRFRPKQYKQEQQSSHERKHRRQEQDHSHSKEHAKKKYYDQSSNNRGRYNKKSNEHSNENSKERDPQNDSGSGEWHERMMQQRENARHKHAQKRNNNNWYIERGDGREQMRSGETQR